MRSVKSLLAAGAATLISSMAFAADMPIAAPPPMYAPVAPPADFGGWYLRGDVGMTNQRAKSIESALPAGYSKTTEGLGFDSAGLFDLGVGYRFNNWFRADLIGQYRGKSNLHGSDNVVGPGFVGVNNYTGSKSEWVVMANAYVDLGTVVHHPVHRRRCRRLLQQDQRLPRRRRVIQPRSEQQRRLLRRQRKVGHGLGRPRRSRLQGQSRVHRRTGLQLHESRRRRARQLPPVRQQRFRPHLDQGQDITSHDVKIGVRWDLNSPPAYMPPLVTKG